MAVDEGVSCYAEVETRTSHGEDNRTVMSRKSLSQCMYIGSKRICRVKAVLPPDCRVGWLKIYAGPRYIASVSLLYAKLLLVNMRIYKCFLGFKYGKIARKPLPTCHDI